LAKKCQSGIFGDERGAKSISRPERESWHRHPLLCFEIANGGNKSATVQLSACSGIFLCVC
jgi:hypothetical protein